MQEIGFLLRDRMEQQKAAFMIKREDYFPKAQQKVKIHL